MAFNKQSLIAAAEEFFRQNPRQAEKYLSPTLLATVVKEMEFRNALPSVVSAEIAFKRLVADGRLPRTDGKTARDDFNEDVKRAQQNLDKAIREADAPPLTKDELDYFVRVLSGSAQARALQPKKQT